MMKFSRPLMRTKEEPRRRSKGSRFTSILKRRWRQWRRRVDWWRRG